MDLVTSAIVSAINLGTRLLARETVALSYAHLKTIIHKKFSNADEILDAILNLEADPDSVSRLFSVREQLAAANAAADVDVLMAAQTLLYQIHPPPAVPVFHAPAAAPAAEQAPAPAQAAAPAPNYAVIKVFFATDRNLTRDTLPARKFGTQRSELSYGSCDISIPRDHRMGELESPSLWRLEFRQDPGKHVVLLEVKTQEKTMFFAALSAQIRKDVAATRTWFKSNPQTTAR